VSVRARRGPVSPMLLPLTLPMSWAYGAAIALRNARFDRGRGVRRAALPTISIGNIVAGGSGKSPVVAWLVQGLRAAGHRPMIALRGYGGRSPADSDEAIEHARRCPDVPVIVGGDRFTAIAAALARGVEADCVVLDDGFQHRQLARDLDIVLVDARRPALDGDLLPAGWLREPATALRRADAVVVTHADAAMPGLSEEIGRRHGRPPLAWVEHRWEALELWRADDAGKWRIDETVAVEWLAGKRVVALLGLADPSSVVAMAERAGATVELLRGRDHQRYDRSWIGRLRTRLDSTRADSKRADGALVTGKDWAKVEPLLDSMPDRTLAGRTIVVPRLAIVAMQGGEALAELVRETVSRHADDRQIAARSHRRPPDSPTDPAGASRKQPPMSPR